MPISLSDKWGSEDIWLRALFVKANLIWIFREEFPKLLLGELNWLYAILGEAYLVAAVEAKHFESNEAAFDRSVELVKNNIEQRIATMGSDAELERLKALIGCATICDPLRQIFDRLAKKTRVLYGAAFSRKTELEPTWLIDHPLRALRPGEYPDPYHVTAQTRLRGENADIELQIHLDGFEVRSLLAIPALLTHELVCHAHAREDSYDSRSIWAEGVMDWTALFFFEQWSWCLGLPYAITDEHGKILWERRVNTARLTGRYAAASLTEWLASESSVRSISVARRVTARFALEVNSSEASLRLKDTLATRLANVLKDKELQEGVRAWRNSGASVADLLG
jgi:hypothetical protein